MEYMPIFRLAPLCSVYIYLYIYIYIYIYNVSIIAKSLGACTPRLTMGSKATKEETPDIKGEAAIATSEEPSDETVVLKLAVSSGS